MPWWLWAIVGLGGSAVLAAAAFVVLRRIDRRIPPPTNFAEGLRSLDNALAAASGPFYGSVAIALICFLMFGGWSKAEEHTIVLILGFTLGGYVALQAVVTIGLLVGGPVGRFDLDADKTGIRMSASTDPDATPPPIVRAAAEGAASGAVAAATTQAAPPPGAGPTGDSE